MATRFFHHYLGLFLNLRDRYTYLNFERYGQKNDLTSRNHHDSGLSFRSFNQRLIEKYTSSRRMIAFDSFLHSKESSKRIPDVGYFSLAVRAGQMGLETVRFCVVEIVALLGLGRSK